MGCAFSRRRTTISSPSLFKVTNIDDKGKEKFHGQMEVTDCTLVLHTKGEPPIVWPLKTIRRYGFEDFLFCFEAGRSSPYGEGVFAFRSKDAKLIFSVLREILQANFKRTLEATDMFSEAHDYSGQSYTSTYTIEKVYDNISFNDLSLSGESNNNIQPMDLLLDPDTVFLPRNFYENILCDNGEDENDLLSDPFELLKDIPTYTNVETAISTSKSESLQTFPTKKPGYTAIDFNQTMHTSHTSQKMLKGKGDGMRKTRHESTIIHEK